MSNHDDIIIQNNAIMGAKVCIAAPDTGMYLVIGNLSSPESLVHQYEGSIVMKLSSLAFLATLPFHGYLALKKHAGVKKIGPVSIDMERFNRTIRMLTQTGTAKR